MSSARQDARPGLVLYGVPHPNDAPSPGRPPPKYNREVHEKIVQGIRSGFTPEHVAAANGISASAFREWIRKGTEGDPWLTEFAEDVEAARAYALLFREQVINDALRPTEELSVKERIALGEFSLKVLERADTKHWAKMVQHVVQQNTDQMLAVLERGLPPKQFANVLKILAASGPAQAGDIADDDG